MYTIKLDENEWLDFLELTLADWLEQVEGAAEKVRTNSVHFYYYYFFIFVSTIILMFIFVSIFIFISIFVSIFIFIQSR